MTLLALDSLLVDTLDYLDELVATRADPATARDRLRGLRERYPGWRIRLLWQREDYDGSLHYDVLLGQPGAGTISLSFCPEGGLPWSLRGGHRVNDRVLLRVNGTEMELAKAIACLDFLWDQVALTDRLVTACLIEQELDQDPVELSDTELQEGMDAFRRARGLLTAEATSDWMSRRCLSHSDLEELVTAELAVARLRARVTGSRTSAYFEEHRASFDTARITRLRFLDEAQARCFINTVRAGGDFYEGAERAFAEARLLPSPDIFSAVRRGELAPEVAEAVFQAPPGTVLDPYEDGASHIVVRVLTVEPAELDDATKALVQRELFAAWVQRRREAARVEWHWGSVDRTAAITSTNARPSQVALP